MTEKQTCSRCIYDDTLPNITFDDKGVCNYCYQHEAMSAAYPLGEEGERRFQALVDDMKKSGKGKKYDCIVGVSGGCDSSYLVHMMVTKYGLRVLATHFDNTWNSEIATQNIYKVLEKLNVDLYTHVGDNKEMDDLFRATMLSGIKEVDAGTDIAVAATLYEAADKYKIEYILSGDSFRTEGVAPLGWAYVDGGLVKDVHKRFGTGKLRKFPNLPFLSFVRYTLRNIKRIRPLYYIEYDKEAAKKMLSETYGWEWYGGHHLENRFAAFNHLYMYAQKAKLETRLWEHAALVRSGQLTREEALKRLQEPRPYPTELVELVKKRLKFSDAEFEAFAKMPIKHYWDYNSYKRLFEIFRPFFWVMLKLNRVPKTFYDKFCATKEMRVRR